MAKMVRKGDLPVKTCAVCGRPFTWRKKWAKDWEQLRYCSDRCRSARSAAKLSKAGDGPKA
ncbi:DUF2256 domain-containing protein [Rhizobium sp. YIM 134829]|uniref:DUF2256 domain-containing protein n=1 Tax=Rhizobium sp. YIM 134829 TaxID=3390453 RepID=UPI00397E2158